MRDPIESPVLSDHWRTAEGEIIVVGAIQSTDGPFVCFDTGVAVDPDRCRWHARGRQICTPTVWRKLVRDAELLARAEDRLVEEPR